MKTDLIKINAVLDLYRKTPDERQDVFTQSYEQQSPRHTVPKFLTLSHLSSFAVNKRHFTKPNKNRLRMK